MYKKTQQKLLVGFVIFTAALIFSVVSPKSAQAQTFSTIDPSMLVALTNKDRNANNLPPLSVNSVLETAAMAKAQNMVQGEYFSHNSPTGVTPWHWFNVAGYSYAYAGENLAIDFTDSASVETAWMNSPLHRKNILDPNYTEIGIVALKGTYQGHETIYVVQLFGAPSQQMARKNVPIALSPARAVVTHPQSVVLGTSTSLKKKKTASASALASEPKKVSIPKKKAKV